MQEFRLSSMEERNYGIDLLRIVSMMMVVLLHVLGQGGILDGSDPLTVKSETAWLLEIGAYSAVNIYAMISGYVGYVVLCQDLVQVKMRNFSHFNPPEAQPQCVFFHTIV